MPRQAIRHEGDGAEKKFLKLVKSSQKSDSAKRGDAIVNIEGESEYVEVKQCHSDTINQVRAQKYIPLVVYDGKEWIVIPPQEVVLLVSKKSRGQHTEIPFESANLSKKTIPSVFRCSDDQLDTRVRAAVLEGRKYPEVEKMMTDLQTEIQGVSERTKKKVVEWAKGYSGHRS